MIGWGKKEPEPAKRAGPAVGLQGAEAPGDAVATFPRGLPDGDQHKAGAIGRWPSADEVATVPRVSAEQRKARDTRRLWHVPIVGTSIGAH